MRLVTWDWKESGIEQIAQALKEEYGIYLQEVNDTGADNVAVVIGDLPMTEKEAQDFFNWSTQ